MLPVTRGGGWAAFERLRFVQVRSKASGETPAAAIGADDPRATVAGAEIEATPTVETNTSARIAQTPMARLPKGPRTGGD